MSPDFRDMLSTLSAEGAEYLVVGAYALAAHGLPRATNDLDIWVRRTGDNPSRVFQAWPARITVAIDQGLEVPVLSREHLIQNKRAVGRPQDLADVARLEERQ